MTLRDYQASGVEQLRQQFAAGKRAPLYTLSTGGGKTRVFSAIAEKMAAKNKRAVILVHRQELLMQASRSLRDLGVAHGIIAPGWKYRGEPLAVASVQTLASRVKKMSPADVQRLLRFDLVIIDEAHHAVAGQWRTVTQAMPWARLLGVTATAVRSDGKGLGIEAGGVFDCMVTGPSTPWLIDQGFLVRPLTYAPPTQVDLSGVHMRGGDWNAKELSAALDKPRITGDAVAHYARLCPFRPAIVFCASVAHAEHVATEFRAAGFSAKCLDGSMSDTERRAGIMGLANGSIHVLTSCDIISEGTDIPVVAAAILLRPTQSEGLYLQQVGRALRPVYAKGFDLGTRAGRLAAIAASDKPHALLLDHVGNCLVHGMADEHREWSLAGKPPRKGKKQEPRQIPLKQCPQCYAFHEPAPVCPLCGHKHSVQARDVETVAGELKQLTPEEIEAIRRKKKVEQRQAHSAEELIRLGVQRQYKSPVFWALKVLEKRGVSVKSKELFEIYSRIKMEIAA